MAKKVEMIVSVEFPNPPHGFIQFSYPRLAPMPKVGETVIYETETSRRCYSGKVVGIRHNVSHDLVMITIQVRDKQQSSSNTTTNAKGN